MLAPLNITHKAVADPASWLATTPLLDLDDPRLRVRVHQLTQFAKSDRERALALYGFVKRIPYEKGFKMRLHTAREVLDQGRGDAADKATLLVAMLRLAELPARLRYLTLNAAVMRGFRTGTPRPTRPVLEIYSDRDWVCTDTFVFDAEYVAAVHKRLQLDGWHCGYGLHRRGQSLWDGRTSGYSFSDRADGAPMIDFDHGVFCDPLEFISSDTYRRHHVRLSRAVHWNLISSSMDRTMRDLRLAFRFA